MKSYYKRIRAIRRLAVAGCLVALAVPAGASAMQPNDSGLRHENSWQSQSQYQLPSNFRTEVQTPASQSQPYQLPVHFRAEVQTPPSQPAPTHTAFVLRRTSSPEGVPAPQGRYAPTASVVHQFETVSDNGGRTLAIVLAAIALAIAICSLAYATVRTTQIQRRQLGSH
jgi:hypothetical protein